MNVGKPTGEMRVFATGTDPLSPSLTYKVFARDYANALVLYKPLSYTAGIGEGATATKPQPRTNSAAAIGSVNANGTLGPVISSISLRNGEGAVLIKA